MSLISSAFGRKPGAGTEVPDHAADPVPPGRTSDATHKAARVRRDGEAAEAVQREKRFGLLRRTIAHEAVQLAMEQGGIRTRSDKHTLAEMQIEAILGLVYRGLDGTVPEGAWPVTDSPMPSVLRGLSEVLDSAVSEMRASHAQAPAAETESSHATVERISREISELLARSGNPPDLLQRAMEGLAAAVAPIAPEVPSGEGAQADQTAE